MIIILIVAAACMAIFALCAVAAARHSDDASEKMARVLADHPRETSGPSL